MLTTSGWRRRISGLLDNYMRMMVALLFLVVAVARGFVTRPGLVVSSPPVDRRWSRAAAREVSPSSPSSSSSPEKKNPVAADWGAYSAALAVQAVPVFFADKASHYFFFLSLATVTVYLAAKAPTLAPAEAGSLTVRQAALAPVFASAALGALYYAITVLGVDPSLFYRVLTSVLAAFATSVFLDDVLDCLVVVPQAGSTRLASSSSPGQRTGVVSAGLSAAVTGAYFAGADPSHCAAGNFLAWTLALVAARSVPLASFRVGALLLTGLFFYDIYFVFFSDAMVTVAKAIDVPVKLVAPNPAGSAWKEALLGLGDVAVPAIIVAFYRKHGDALGDPRWTRNAVLAYAIGLGAAFYANEFVRPGQPALLYLVPAVLTAGVATALQTPEGLPGLLAFNATLATEDPRIRRPPRRR